MALRGRGRLPRHIDHCLWNLERSRLRVDRDADVILGRVLEFGVLEDVLWAMRTYGLPRIHRFLRTVGSPEMSERTVRFWQTLFRAEGEHWPRPAKWRRLSSAPWVE